MANLPPAELVVTFGLYVPPVVLIVPFQLIQHLHWAIHFLIDRERIVADCPSTAHFIVVFQFELLDFIVGLEKDDSYHEEGDREGRVDCYCGEVGRDRVVLVLEQALPAGGRGGRWGNLVWHLLYHNLQISIISFTQLVGSNVRSSREWA